MDSTEYRRDRPCAPVERNDRPRRAPTPTAPTPGDGAPRSAPRPRPPRPPPCRGGGCGGAQEVPRRSLATPFGHEPTQEVTSTESRRDRPYVHAERNDRPRQATTPTAPTHKDGAPKSAPRPRPPRPRRAEAANSSGRGRSRGGYREFCSDQTHSSKWLRPFTMQLIPGSYSYSTQSTKYTKGKAIVLAHSCIFC